MASTETEDTFPVELLPTELIENIAVFLTPKELAACCAVSCNMRELFGDDVIWRGRCNRDLVEYLSTTTCKLDPPFVSPQTKESTLSPICFWRMTFMRENHLWNNWRQGKSSTEVIQNQHSEDSKYNTICHIFLTSDVILAFFRDRIELLDVREHPAADATPPIHLNSYFSQETQLKSGNDMILTMRETLVQVHKVNLSERVCTLRHEFFLNRSEKLAVSGKYDNESTKRCLYEMIGHYFIGVIKGESIMHIWNLETGEKLKEEVCPLVRSCQISQIKPSTRLNLIITVKVGSGDVNILAYSLSSLSYLPFKETYKTNVDCYVCENFVGIHHNGQLDVFNYQTPELLLKDQLIIRHPQFLNSNFVFIDDQTLKMFNPRTRVLKSTPLQGINWFEIMCGRFIQVRRGWNSEIWEICGNFEGVKKTSMNLGFDACAFYLNKTCSRYIVRSGVGSVIHFW
uniref:F-box domain-containing protein n=1 Tax=Graphocephala atropunctata TaxID=36148 RepID=A0A1B6LFD5_9HEMI